MDSVEESATRKTKGKICDKQLTMFVFVISLKSLSGRKVIKLVAAKEIKNHHKLITNLTISIYHRYEL